MSMNKEMLAPKELTSKELQVLVDEYVANGGVITQCDPGVALNFRTPEIPKVSRPKHLRKPVKKTKKPVKKTKAKR